MEEGRTEDVGKRLKVRLRHFFSSSSLAKYVFVSIISNRSLWNAWNFVFWPESSHTLFWTLKPLKWASCLKNGSESVFHRASEVWIFDKWKCQKGYGKQPLKYSKRRRGRQPSRTKEAAAATTVSQIQGLYSWRTMMISYTSKISNGWRYGVAHFNSTFSSLFLW